MNFGIGSAFSKGSGSAFSEGPGPGTGPLYKVCRVGLGLFMSYHFSFSYFRYNESHNLIKTDTLVFFHIFKNISHYFWMMITWMKKVNNFKIAKVHSQRVA